MDFPPRDRTRNYQLTPVNSWVTIPMGKREAAAQGRVVLLPGPEPVQMENRSNPTSIWETQYGLARALSTRSRAGCQRREWRLRIRV